MQEYHAQGLSQSRISFWFSLVFASLGFAIIALSVGIFLQGSPSAAGGWLDAAGKPTFTLIAGAIIDADARRQHEFRLRPGQELVFEGGLQVLPSTRARSAGDGKNSAKL